MIRWLKVVARLSIILAGLTADSCFAAGDFVSSTAGDEAHEQSWNREQKTNTKESARALAQHKAQVRAEQRQARLASMSWYGMSNGRPIGAPTPFMSRYSPVWEMPGGRPFSWYPAGSQQSNYVFYWR